MPSMPLVQRGCSHEVVNQGNASEHNFLDKWASELLSGHDSAAEEYFFKHHAMGGGADKENKTAAMNATPRDIMNTQPFVINQAPNIRDRSVALRKFWDTYGSVFRRTWTAWTTLEPSTCMTAAASSWISIQERQRQQKMGANHNHCEDLRPLVGVPIGNVARGQPSFLNDITEMLGKGKDLLELIRTRATQMCLEEDVLHVSRLKARGKLAPLFCKSDGDYLCKDMIEADDGRGACAGCGPFVVFIGTSPATYNATGVRS